MSKKIGSRITLTITREQRARLEQLTKETGVSVAERVRRAINSSFVLHVGPTASAEVLDAINSNAKWVKCADPRQPVLVATKSSN